MLENSSPARRGFDLRKWRGLILYPAWVAGSYIVVMLLLGGVHVDGVGIPGVLELLNALGLPFNAVNPSLLSLLLSTIATLIIILMVIGLPHKFPRRRTTTWRELGLARFTSWSDIGLGILGFLPYILGSLLLLSVVQQLIPGFNVDEVQEIGFDTSIVDRFSRVMAFVALVIVAPVCEEILFRGYLYGKIRRYGVALAAIVTSVVFALLHGQWNVAIDVFALSLVLCYLREFTGSIWAGIVLHMVKNSIAYYFLFIAPLMVL